MAQFGRFAGFSGTAGGNAGTADQAFADVGETDFTQIGGAIIAELLFR